MNAVGWFEIPVTDMDRAIHFYNTVLDLELKANPMGPLIMAWFPSDPEAKGAPGSLVKHEESYTPSKDGVLIYFSCADVQVQIGKVEEGGGTVILEKRLIAEDVGYMGLAVDSEGNRIAFHSRA